jgi:hypothetical protein
MIVIGNGESRQRVDLGKIYGKKIGCNLAFQDIDLDHLVCIDRNPLKEALAAGLDKTNIWTRPEYVVAGCDVVPDVPQGNQRPDQPRHWGSGPYAVLIATILSKDIHMVGFDLYSNNDLINNVYKGQKHYAAADSIAVDPRYWIYQIGRVFSTNSDKYFIVYNTSDWQMPAEWCLANVEFKTLDSLYSRL